METVASDRRIPYEHYFEVSMVPEPGVSIHSYEYLLRMTDGMLDEHPVVDSHTHLGSDEDGRSLALPELLDDLDRFHVDSAVVFPFNDPERGSDFQIPNDRVWEAYEQAPDRLVPFMRLDPTGPWEKEYSRCRDRGHRGLKLHPRAQNFSIGSLGVREVFAAAAEDGLPVLIHTGFGVSSAADELAGLVSELPGLTLILGHSSFMDISAALRVLGPHPDVYFETSVVTVYDLFEVLSTVDPCRVLYGSDLPYAASYSSMQALASTAYFAGVDSERIPDLFGGNLLRLLERQVGGSETERR